MARLRGIIPGLEEAQRGLVPEERLRAQPSVLEHQYPLFRDEVRQLREAGLPEGLIAEILAKAESTLKTEFKGRLTEQDITREVIGRQPGAGQKFLAAATRASGLGFLQDPFAREAEQQATGLPGFAGRVVGTLPLLAGTTAAAARIPALAARPLLREAATGAAFGALEPIARGEEPSLGGIAGSAALFGGLGAVARRFKAPPPVPRPITAGGAQAIPIQQLWEDIMISRPETVSAPIRDLVKLGLSRAKKGVTAAGPGFPELFAAEAQPLEHVAKQQFDDAIELSLGFNPLKAPGALKDIIDAVWTRGTTPASVETTRRALGRTVGGALGALGGSFRLPRSLFRGSAFIERVGRVRDTFSGEQVRYLNLMDDIVKPLPRELRNTELIEALNSQKGFEAASPEVRAVADRLRAEVLDPLFAALKQTKGVRGRDELRYLPFYFRHILDRPETLRHLRQQLAAAEAAGDAAGMAEAQVLLNSFERRGNAAFATTDDFRRIVGSNMRDFFREVPPGEATFGAIEKRMANLPTFLRDFDLVMESYVRGALRKVHYDPELKAIATDIAVLPSGHRGHANRLVRDLLGFRHVTSEKFDDVLRRAGVQWHELTGRGDPAMLQDVLRGENLSRWVTQAEYYRTLWGNAGGAVVNALQVATNLFPLLAQKYGGARAAGLLSRATMMSMGPEGRAIAREIGAFRLKEAAALEGRAELLNRLPILGDFFAIVESRVNRQLSGIAEYLAQREGGLTHEAAITAARKVIRQTQFELDALGRPEILRGPLGRVLGQFQIFKLSQFEFFWNTLDRRGKAYFGAVMLGLGGPSAVPYLGPWLKETLEAEGLPDIGAGVPGAFGLDIARRVNPLEAPFRALTGGGDVERGFIQSTTGPAVGLGVKLVEALRAWFMNDPLAHPREAFRAGFEQALTEVEPVALQRLAQTREVLQTGQVRAGRALALPQLLRGAGIETGGVLPERAGGFGLQQPATPGQQLATLLGVPTQTQRELDIRATEVRRAQALQRTQRDRIVEGYLYFKRSGDAGPMREAISAAPGINVRRILRETEESFEHRMQRRTPRRLRQ